MKALATYVMRGRMQAALVATAFAVLSFVLQPFGFISGAVVALVTLRRGIVEGLTVTAISGLVIGLLAYFAAQQPMLGLLYITAVWLPVVLVSHVLRRTISLSIAISVATVLGMGLVLLVFANVPDPTVFWKEILNSIYTQIMADAPTGAGMLENKDVWLETSAKVMTGLVGGAFLLGIVFSLLIGRWWQAMLYNPGGFQQEFLALRFGRIEAGIGLVLSSVLSLLLIWAV
jgi:hypothetical protein